MAENRSSKRQRWRLPCEIVYDGGRQRSFVVDLSETGLFVQTGARLRPGTEVEVRLTLDRRPAPVVLRTRVARTKQVPSHLMSVARSGIGLRLLDAPDDYLAVLADLKSGAR